MISFGDTQSNIAGKAIMMFFGWPTSRGWGESGKQRCRIRKILDLAVSGLHPLL